MLTKDDAIAKLQNSINHIEKLKLLGGESPELEKWRRGTTGVLERIFGKHSPHLDDFSSLNFNISMNDLIRMEKNPLNNGYQRSLDSAKSKLQMMVEEIEEYWGDEISKQENMNLQQAEAHSHKIVSPCIFLGHGRSALWARLQLFIESELGLKTINYESESRTGESIVNVLEQMLDEASFAVLILTAEDETVTGSRRARQNVVHEAGLFQGKLGFKKAILLVQDGLEEFSNVAGLQHIPFSGDRIDQTFYELQRALKREGLI